MQIFNFAHDKEIWKNGVIPPLVFNLGNNWEWLALYADCFTPGKIIPCSYWIWSWVGHSAGLNYPEQRKISCFCWEWN